MRLKNSIRVFGNYLALSVLLALSLLLTVASVMLVSGAPFLPVYIEVFSFASIISVLLMIVSILCSNC